MSAAVGDQPVTTPAVTSTDTPPSGYAVRRKPHPRHYMRERFLDLLGAVLIAKGDYEVNGASAADVARSLRQLAEDAAYLAADLEATEAVR